MKKTWKAPLPPPNPDDGMCHVVFSVKHSNGSRAEFVGKVLITTMKAAMDELLKDYK